MVELTMMGRLLEALRPECRLVLVGDPRQLTSVGAGAVLSDLVAGYEGRPDSPVSALTENFRSEEDIKSLAAALREGDADEVLRVLRAPSDQVSFVEAADEAAIESALRPDSVAAGRAVWEAASNEDPAGALAELDRYRLLCAHREGPYGVRRWNQLVERWLAEDTDLDPYGVWGGQWYVGRPLLVTSNDYALDVYNGETGVVVRQGARRRAFVAGSERLKEFAPGRLDAVETMHAMTIHKSQGSQADRVTVLLPDEGSRLLTCELFYTAVTRARRHVRVVGLRGRRTRGRRRAGPARHRAAAAVGRALVQVADLDDGELAGDHGQRVRVARVAGEGDRARAGGGAGALEGQVALDVRIRPDAVRRGVEADSRPGQLAVEAEVVARVGLVAGLALDARGDDVGARRHADAQQRLRGRGCDRHGGRERVAVGVARTDGTRRVRRRPEHPSRRAAACGPAWTGPRLRATRS